MAMAAIKSLSTILRTPYYHVVSLRIATVNLNLRRKKTTAAPDLIKLYLIPHLETMISRVSLLIIALAACPFSVAGFSVPKHVECKSTTELSAVVNGRRNFLAAVTGAVMVAGTAGALPAWAEVSAGNSLPQGAQQFSNMIRVKGDLKVGCCCLGYICS